MNINQQQLTEKEQELIEKVLNFSLNINTTTFCFKNIADKVELDLSIPSHSTLEKVDVYMLTKKKQELEKEIQQVEGIITKIRCLTTMEARNQLRANGPWKKKGPHWGPEDYYGFLLNKKATLDQMIANRGEFSTPLLGSFDESKKTVFLYLNNIQKERGTSQRGETYTFRTFVIVTFIHEMFHAWNFFACGNEGRSILEIDEPMVEFATLLFLQEIAKDYPDYKGKESFAAFERISEFAIENVHDKQDAIGETASYGFGYFLNSLLGSKEEKRVLEMLTEYEKKSGSIKETDAVKEAKAQLCPYYPFNEENKLFELLYAIIVHGDCYHKKLQIQQKHKGLSGWQLEVFECVKRIPSKDFSMDDIYAFENELQQSHPNNHSIKAKIRQQLQDLCEKGLIMRVENGYYTKQF